MGKAYIGFPNPNTFVLYIVNDDDRVVYIQEIDKNVFDILVSEGIEDIDDLTIKIKYNERP